jgi:hypothetical protein
MVYRATGIYFETVPATGTRSVPECHEAVSDFAQPLAVRPAAWASADLVPTREMRLTSESPFREGCHAEARSTKADLPLTSFAFGGALRFLALVPSPVFGG